MKKFFVVCILVALVIGCHSGQDPKDPPEEAPEGMPEEWWKEWKDWALMLPCDCVTDWIQDDATCQRDLPWDYPVKPGMEEWEQHKDRNERIEACQIPVEVCSWLSTDDLISINILNPIILGTLYAFTPLERGIDSLFRLNGIRELFQRDDMLDGLLNWYDCAIQKLPSFLEGEPSLDQAHFLFQIALATFLMSRYESPDGSIENYVKIVQHLLCAYELMYMYYPLIVDCESFGANLFTRAKILVKIDGKNLEKIPMGINNELFRRVNCTCIGGCEENTRLAIDQLSCQLIN